jgi:SAM-dependent methyltransferase
MVLDRLKSLSRSLSAVRPPASAMGEALNNRLAAAQSAGRRVMCNLGCGTRHHPDWINVDFVGDGVHVLAWDLRYGLPLPDQSCDVVYSSHIIEHFDRAGARQFLCDCRRLLKPAGIVRVVAPDLEGLARSYLSRLAAARRGEPDAAAQYEWSVIELIDQMVRHRSGGEMLEHWCLPEVPAEEFVAERVGTEYWQARQHCKGRKPSRARLEARGVGRFRLGGEVHQWMYDSYSLSRLLTTTGFIDVRSCAAEESRIEDFASFLLDSLPDGATYKPDSFFMEAVAPAARS